MDELFDQLVRLNSGMNRALNNSPAVHFETFIPAAAPAPLVGQQGHHLPSSSLPTTTGGSPLGKLEQQQTQSERELRCVTPMLPVSLQQQSRSSTPPGFAVSPQQLACSIDLFSFSGGTAAANKVLSLEPGRGGGSAPDIGGAGSAAGGFGSVFGGVEWCSLGGATGANHTGTMPTVSVAAAAGRGHLFSSGGGFKSQPR
jgi:hypothetical protein